jgi:GxxExxY protein
LSRSSESAYLGVLVVELKQTSISFQLQQVFPLVYKTEYVGVYIADILFDNKIILELKSVSQLTSGMDVQLILPSSFQVLQSDVCSTFILSDSSGTVLANK